MNRLGKPKGSFGWHLKKFWFSLIVGCIFLPTTSWSSEATLRVAFVFNFMKFIEWPDIETTSTLNLCAVRPDEEIRTALDQLKDKTVNKRGLKLTYLNTDTQLAADLASCHLIYQPWRSANVRLPELLPKGVILVADEPKQITPNIGISLTRTSEGRIEFVINPGAIERAGVTVSSQLLKLAKNTQRVRA